MTEIEKAIEGAADAADAAEAAMKLVLEMGSEGAGA